jgi:hypothetical protein
MESAASEQGKPGAIGARDFFQRRPMRLRIGAHVCQPERGVTLDLDVARAPHAGGDLAAAFARRRQNQIGGGHRRHLDVQVDAVE